MIEGKCKPGGCASIGCEGGFYCFNADGTPKPDLTPAQQEQLRGALATFCADEKRDEVLLREPVTLDDVMREVKALREDVRRLAKQVPTPGLPIGWDMNKCGKCGIVLNGVMGYVCTQQGCPTGLGGFCS
jgi:hypothetical protein